MVGSFIRVMTAAVYVRFSVMHESVWCNGDYVSDDYVV